MMEEYHSKGLLRGNVKVSLPYIYIWVLGREKKSKEHQSQLQIHQQTTCSDISTIIQSLQDRPL